MTSSTWPTLLRHLRQQPGIRGLILDDNQLKTTQRCVESTLIGTSSVVDVVASEVDACRNAVQFPSTSTWRPHSRREFLGQKERCPEQDSAPYDFILLNTDAEEVLSTTNLEAIWQSLRPGGVFVIPSGSSRAGGAERVGPIDEFLRARSDLLHLTDDTDLAVRRRTNIEAVVTCVGYADYLTHTLPLLVRRVDKVVVVSAPDDTSTERVVSREPLAELVQTDVFFRDGAPFNKGAAINQGLKRLTRSAWILQVDADTAIHRPLPTITDPGILWGAERRRVVGREDFDHALNYSAADLPRYPTCRISGEVTPLGYFSLWYWPAAPVWMSERWQTAGDSDIEFSCRWQPKRRRYLDAFEVLHLEMPDQTKGMNWKGRNSRTFDYLRAPSDNRAPTRASPAAVAKPTVAVNAFYEGAGNISNLRGVLTAANSDYWPVLRLQTQSVRKAGFCMAVVDHGLEPQQRSWLEQHDALVVDVPASSAFTPVSNGAQQVEPTSPPEAWLKPWLCLHTPFENTLWIDADAIPVRGLDRMFRLLEQGDWLTLESWASEKQMRQAYLSTAQRMIQGGLSERYYNASKINAGVFGFRRSQPWLQSWWDQCVEIANDSALLNSCRLRDQAAMVVAMCRMDKSVNAPRIQLDRGLNWPANGLRCGQGHRRKRYQWFSSGVLRELAQDHPHASVVHWMGNPKPWLPERRKNGKRKTVEMS